MQMSIGLMVGIITAIYLLGIFIITYIHGLTYPTEYEMDVPGILGAVFWPVTLVFAIPVALLAGLIGGVIYIGETLRQKGQVSDMEMYEDELHQDMVLTQDELDKMEETPQHDYL